MKNFGKYLILTASLFMLVGCGETKTPTQKTDVPEEPKATLEISTSRSSFRYGDRLNPSDFTVKKDGTVIENVSIENYNFFNNKEQEVKFVDKDSGEFGFYKLTLTPRTENLKVLFIANSHADDTLTYSFRQIKTVKGVNLDDVHFVNNFKGACDLQMYNNEFDMELYTYNDFNTEDPYSDKEKRSVIYAVEKENWDYIVLQQYTQQYFLKAQFSCINSIVEMCKEHCSNPDCQYLFNMTFAYPDGSNLSNFKAKYEGKCDNLYNDIADKMQNIVLKSKYIENIIPLATAIRNAQTSYLSVDDLFRDDGNPMYYEHLSLGYGRFIAGMLFVCCMTGFDPSEITFTNGYDEKFMNVARESVRNALENRFEFTESQYK